MLLSGRQLLLLVLFICVSVSQSDEDTFTLGRDSPQSNLVVFKASNVAALLAMLLVDPPRLVFSVNPGSSSPEKIERIVKRYYEFPPYHDSLDDSPPQSKDPDIDEPPDDDLQPDDETTEPRKNRDPDLPCYAQRPPPTTTTTTMATTTKAQGCPTTTAPPPPPCDGDEPTTTTTTALPPCQRARTTTPVPVTDWEATSPETYGRSSTEWAGPCPRNRVAAYIASTEPTRRSAPSKNMWTTTSHPSEPIDDVDSIELETTEPETTQSVRTTVIPNSTSHISRRSTTSPAMSSSVRGRHVSTQTARNSTAATKTTITTRQQPSEDDEDPGHDESVDSHDDDSDRATTPLPASAPPKTSPASSTTRVTRRRTTTTAPSQATEETTTSPGFLQTVTSTPRTASTSVTRHRNTTPSTSTTNSTHSETKSKRHTKTTPTTQTTTTTTATTQTTTSQTTSEPQTLDKNSRERRIRATRKTSTAETTTTTTPATTSTTSIQADDDDDTGKVHHKRRRYYHKPTTTPSPTSTSTTSTSSESGTKPHRRRYKHRSTTESTTTTLLTTLTTTPVELTGNSTRPKRRRYHHKPTEPPTTTSSSGAISSTVSLAANQTHPHRYRHRHNHTTSAVETTSSPTVFTSTGNSTSPHPRRRRRKRTTTTTTTTTPTTTTTTEMLTSSKKRRRRRRRMTTTTTTTTTTTGNNSTAASGGGWFDPIKRAGGAVRDGAEKVGEVAKDGAVDVGEGTIEAGKDIGSGVEWAGKKLIGYSLMSDFDEFDDLEETDEVEGFDWRFWWRPWRIHSRSKQVKLDRLRFNDTLQTIPSPSPNIIATTPISKIQKTRQSLDESATAEEGGSSTPESFVRHFDHMEDQEEDEDQAQDDEDREDVEDEEEPDEDVKDSSEQEAGVKDFLADTTLPKDENSGIEVSNPQMTASDSPRQPASYPQDLNIENAAVEVDEQKLDSDELPLTIQSQAMMGEDYSGKPSTVTRKRAESEENASPPQLQTTSNPSEISPSITHSANLTEIVVESALVTEPGTANQSSTMATDEFWRTAESVAPVHLVKEDVTRNREGAGSSQSDESRSGVLQISKSIWTSLRDSFHELTEHMSRIEELLIDIVNSQSQNTILGYSDLEKDAPPVLEGFASNIHWDSVVHESETLFKDFVPLTMNPWNESEWMKIIRDSVAIGKEFGPLLQAHLSVKGSIINTASDPVNYFNERHAWLQDGLRHLQYLVDSVSSDNLCRWYRQPGSCAAGSFSAKCRKDLIASWNGRKSEVFYSEDLGAGYVELSNNPVKALKTIIQVYCSPFIKDVHTDAVLEQHTAVAHHVSAEKASTADPTRFKGRLSNDPMSDQQWHLEELKISRYWRQTAQTAAGIPAHVMIVDSGIDHEHEDLNFWINENELEGRTLVDDDSNGAIDDIYGLNAYGLDGNVTDTDGHGTYLAGIISASVNNEVGVASVSSLANSIPCRMMTSGLGALSNLLKCLAYAVRMNVEIILMPFGTRQRLPVLTHAIEQVAEAGSICVASTSGPVGRIEWPALYAFESKKFRVLPVTGLTATYDHLMSHAPPAEAGIDLIGAPGENIVSLGQHSTYGSGSGNAPAAAVAAGLLSLTYHQITYDEIYRAMASRRGSDGMIHIKDLFGK